MKVEAGTDAQVVLLILDGATITNSPGSQSMWSLVDDAELNGSNTVTGGTFGYKR